jgi:hypothetical protein
MPLCRIRAHAVIDGHRSKPKIGSAEMIYWIAHFARMAFHEPKGDRRLVTAGTENSATAWLYDSRS